MVSERAERTPRRSAAAFSVVLSAVAVTAVMVVAVGGAASMPLGVTFDAAQTGFGFDANQLMQGFSVSIFNAAGQIFTADFAQPDGIKFFGFTSSAGDITSAIISSRLLYRLSS